MKRYKVELVARFVAFQEIEIEAETEFDARQGAWDCGQRLAKINSPAAWDIQYIDYHNSARRNRDGTPVCVYEVEVNAIGEMKE